MKKNILAIAIASAVATPVVMANGPTVYGQFNFAVDMLSTNTISATYVTKQDVINDSVAAAPVGLIEGDYKGYTIAGQKGMNTVTRNSRLGVKGSEDLGNGLKAIYQAEGTVGMGTFQMDRNTFAGISGGFGTVVMGRHDTPLRMIQPNDGFADSQFGGNNTSNFTGLDNSGEDRLNQVLAYISPSFNGVQVAVAGASLHGGAGVGGNTPLSPDNGTESALTNALSYSVAYGSKSKGIYVAAAATTVEASRSDRKNERDNMRVTAQYNEAGLTASVMYNTLAVGDDYVSVAGWSAADRAAASEMVSGNAITVGASYKMGAMTPRAKVAMITYDTKDADNKNASMSMALGLDYALGKTTSVYAEYASLDKYNRRVISVNSDLDPADLTVMSVGLFHKF